MSRKPLRWLAGVAALVLTSSLVACGGSSDPDDDSGATFVLAAAGVPGTLDPWAHYEGDSHRLLMFEWASTLVAYDATKAPNNGCDRLVTSADLMPRLATSWEYNEDRTQLRFTLRQGVKSPLGNTLTAEDVVWSLNRAKALSPVARFLMANVGHFQEENTFEALDEYTFAVNLAEATSLDVALFTYPLFGVVDSTAAKANANGEEWAESWLAENFVNFGPWQLESFEPSSQVVYTANPNYWDDDRRGNVDRLVIRSVPEASTRLQLLETGEVDYAERLSFDQYVRVAQTANTQLVQCVSPNRDTLMLNNAFEPFADPKVRQAISLAIDREALVRAVYQDLFQPSTTGLSAVYWQPGPQAKEFTYDPERARQLLEEAGATGLSFTITASPTRPGAWAQPLAVQIQQMLRDVGLDVDINMVPGATEFSDAFFEGNYEAIVYLEPPALGDAFYSLNLYNTTVSFQNTFKYKNDRYDELTFQVLRTDPGPQRDALLAEVSDLIVDDVPQVYLAEQNYLHAFSDKISGYGNTPVGQLFVYQLTKN